MPNLESLEVDSSVTAIQNWTALSSGAALMVYGATRRSLPGFCLALAAAPLVYRGATGRWPGRVHAAPIDDTRTALSGQRGIQVREAIRLERPIGEVYAQWRRLSNLPRFMTHLSRVEERDDRVSHWVAKGPGGVAVEWDAEIINEVPDQVLAWRSLPGGDVVTAGSVNFDRERSGRITQVTVHLQYAPPGGRAGALIATLFGREPSQTIREDLRRFKQVMEAGEAAVATARDVEAYR